MADCPSLRDISKLQDEKVMKLQNQLDGVQLQLENVVHIVSKIQERLYVDEASSSTLQRSHMTKATANPVYESEDDYNDDSKARRPQEIESG